MEYSNRQCNREILLKSINEISFVLDELRLYLDTHPSCAEALKMFSEYQKKRHSLMADYTKNFGPIFSYYAETDSTLWTWATDSMPWDE